MQPLTVKNMRCLLDPVWYWLTVSLVLLGTVRTQSGGDPGHMSGYHFNSDPHSGTFSYGFMVHRANPLDRSLSRTGGLQRRTTDPVTSYGTQHERQADGQHNWGFFIADDSVRPTFKDITDRSGRVNGEGVEDIRTHINYGAGKQPLVFKVSPRPGPPIPEVVSTSRPPGFLRPRPTTSSSHSFTGSGPQNSRPDFHSNVGPSAERPNHHLTNVKPVVAHVTIDKSKKRPIVIKVNPPNKAQLPSVSSTGSIKPHKNHLKPGALPGIIVRDNPPPGPPFPEVVTDRPVRRPPNGGLREVYRPKPSGVFFVQGRIEPESGTGDHLTDNNVPTDLQTASSAERHVAMHKEDFVDSLAEGSSHVFSDSKKLTEKPDSIDRKSRSRSGRNLFSQRHGRLLDDINMNNIKFNNLPDETTLSETPNGKISFRGRVKFSDTNKERRNIIRVHIPDHSTENQKKIHDSDVTLVQPSSAASVRESSSLTRNGHHVDLSTLTRSGSHWNPTPSWKPRRRTFLNVQSSQPAPFHQHQSFTNRDIIRHEPGSFLHTFSEALDSNDNQGESSPGVTEEPEITTYRPTDDFMNKFLLKNNIENIIFDTLFDPNQFDSEFDDDNLNESLPDTNEISKNQQNNSKSNEVEITTYRPHSFKDASSDGKEKMNVEAVQNHIDDQQIQFTTNSPLITRHLVNQGSFLRPFRGNVRFDDSPRLHPHLPIFGELRPFSKIPVVFPTRAHTEYTSNVKHTLSNDNINQHNAGAFIVTARPVHSTIKPPTLIPSPHLIPPTVPQSTETAEPNEELIKSTEEQLSQFDPHLREKGIVITHNGQRNDRKPEILESGSEKFRSHMQNEKLHSIPSTTPSNQLSTVNEPAPISEQHLQIGDVHLHSVTRHPIYHSRNPDQFISEKQWPVTRKLSPTSPSTTERPTSFHSSTVIHDNSKHTGSTISTSTAVPVSSNQPHSSFFDISTEFHSSTFTESPTTSTTSTVSTTSTTSSVPFSTSQSYSSTPPPTATASTRFWRPTIGNKLNWNSRPHPPPFTIAPVVIPHSTQRATTKSSTIVKPIEQPSTETYSLLPVITSTPLPIQSPTSPVTAESTPSWLPSISGEVSYFDPSTSFTSPEQKDKQRQDHRRLARLGGEKKLNETEKITTISSSASTSMTMPVLSFLLSLSLIFVL